MLFSYPTCTSFVFLNYSIKYNKTDDYCNNYRNLVHVIFVDSFCQPFLPYVFVLYPSGNCVILTPRSEKHLDCVILYMSNSRSCKSLLGSIQVPCKFYDFLLRRVRHWRCHFAWNVHLILTMALFHKSLKWYVTLMKIFWGIWISIWT